MTNLIEKDARELYKIRFLDIYMLGHKGFIAGGCFKNIFQNIRLKDIDIFFENEKDFAEANIYFKADEGYVCSYENKNTVAYKNKKTNIRVELVRNTYGTPEEIMNRFDFSITKFAYFKKVTVSDAVVLNDETTIEYKCLVHELFFEHLVCKKLVLEKEILFPVSTFERSYRYRQYGFGLCRESKENLLTALQGADISNLSNELYFGID